MMDRLLAITLISILYFTGASVHAQKQVIPEGISAVNGSSTEMGCTGREQDGSHTLCDCSYLIDGVSPDIDTSSSNWASQLVTVRRSENNSVIHSPHVLLKFGFDTPVSVSMSVIEIDLFNCPDWNIGATSVQAYFNTQYDLSLDISSVQFAAPVPLSQSSCNSLSTVTISSPPGGSFRTIYVVAAIESSSIEWAHVGEVRFSGINNLNCPLPNTSIPPNTHVLTQSSTQYSTHSVSQKGETSSSLSFTHSTLITPSTGTTLVQNFSQSTLALPLSPDASSRMKTSPTTSAIKLPTSSSKISSSETTTQQSEVSHSKTATKSGNETPTLQQSGGENTLAIILVGITVALVVLACIFGGLIILLLTKKHSRCHKNRYTVKTASYELEKRYNPHSNMGDNLAVTNPLRMSNSRYVCPTASVGTNGSDDNYDLIKQENIIPLNEAYYDVVLRDEPLPPAESSTTQIDPPLAAEPSTTHTKPLIPPKPSTTDSVFDEEEELGGGLYDIIRTETRPPVVPARSHSQSNPPPVDQPGASGGAKPGSKDTRVYSIVKRERAPEIPEKNIDLKDYLRVRIPFNENIYSESINPSDFIAQQPESEPEYDTFSDAIIYAPIYPSFHVLPESFELPAEVNTSNIKEKSVVRIGHYGDVVLADTVGLSLKDMHLSKTENNKDVSITVAVKRLRTNATPVQKRAFETEAKFLSRLRHPNVVRLLGASYEEPAFIMVEFLKEGDLSQFLQNYTEVVQEASPSSTTQITPSTLVFMASQIASGMKRLAELNFIHRDLATRNCLVGRKYSVKVASLGVDKNVYQSHYYRVQGKTLLPIRWMASECFDGKFSEKSDVWAFGVTLWEMFTLVKQLPYRHLSNEEVIHNALKREYRLFPSQSPSCPQSVCQIMDRCWILDMQERTNFKELHTLLQTAI